MALEDRLTLFVTQQRGTIVAALLLAGALCLAGAGYVYLTPTTETVTDETNVQTIETDVETSAVVTGNTTLYDAGETLRNRSVYFTSATPNVTFTVRTAVPADQSVTVAHRLRMETVGLRGERPFYREERTLLEQETTVTDRNATARATLNASAVRQSLLEKQEVVAGAGQFRIRLLLNVSYETETYSDTISASTPLVFDGEAYYLDGELAAERTHSTTVTNEVRQPPTLFEYGGLGALGLVLIGLGVVVGRTARHADPERLRTNIVHDRHEEWISRGQIPTESDKQYISILALEDLVDVAIDSSRRVIFDPELDTYAVIDGDEIYYYARNKDDTEAWLDF